MRITNNALFYSMKKQLAQSTSRLLQAQEVAATQKKINRLSDNPQDASRIMDISQKMSQLDQYLRNIVSVNSQTTAQDTVLGQAHDILTRVKELVVAESSEVSSTVATREAARIEIANLTSQLVQLGNTRVSGQYIFSGFQSSTPAFSELAVTTTANGGNTGTAAVSSSVVGDSSAALKDYEIRFTGAGTYDVYNITDGAPLLTGQSYTSGQPINFEGLQIVISNSPGTPQAGDVFTVDTTPPGIYQGDNQHREIEIQNGTRIQQNVTGAEIFQGAGVAGGVDLFQVLNGVNDALASNDQAAISAALDELDVARTQISSARTGVGARANLIDKVRARHEGIKAGLQVNRSNLEDADLAEALTELARQQTAYDATLNAASQVVQNTLLDFLR